MILTDYDIIFPSLFSLFQGEQVAVKKMLVELMEESDLTIFRKEISIMDMYHHPNIVRFIGANLTPPSFCILTEYCARGSLSKVLKTEKDLSWERKLPIAIQTAAGEKKKSRVIESGFCLLSFFFFSLSQA